MFANLYGVHKNGKSANKAISLITKYAFFLSLKQPGQCPDGFPIYDSLAIKMLSQVMCAHGDRRPWPKSTKSSLDIETFVLHIKNFKKLLWGQVNISGVTDMAKYPDKSFCRLQSTEIHGNFVGALQKNIV